MEAILAFLNNPNEGTLAAARQAWLMSRVSYGQSEAFRFYMKALLTLLMKKEAWKVQKDGLIHGF